MTNTGAQLAELRDLITYYPGEWVEASLEQAAVVLAEDPGLSTLVWDSPGGAVSILAADGGTRVVVNTNLKAFIECCRLFTAAVKESERIDAEYDPDKADRLHDKHGKKLLKEFRKIDPAVVRDENDMWAVAAEEIGYGML